MTGVDEPQPAFTILFVCTGNICRSPLAERVGRAYLDARLEADARLVRLVSAGCRAVVGSAMHPDSALVLEGFGGDPGEFEAQQLDQRLVDQSDLTLTMTRTHRAEVLKLAPRALSRTFTLREAAGLLTLVGDVRPEGADFAQRAREIVKLLAAGRPHRHPGDDDVPDPIGQPIEAHQEAADFIADSLLPLLSRVAACRDEPAGAPRSVDEKTS